MLQIFRSEQPWFLILINKKFGVLAFNFYQKNSGKKCNFLYFLKRYIKDYRKVGNDKLNEWPKKSLKWLAKGI